MRRVSRKERGRDRTNVIRLLDNKHIAYVEHTYLDTEAISGVEVAGVLGQNPDKVFKTLVCVGRSREHYVFLVPVAEELDLKKAAAVVGEKAVAMVKSRELLGLTGYIHGGCSPIGMKKFFRTTIDETATLFDTIMFSGGRIGVQVETSLDELAKVIEFELADITVV
ncbi:MAG: Cys-tRNA(Pro) deacylase [Coriobacteriales bacterium]